MNEPKFITQPLTMSDGSAGTITAMHSPLFDGNMVWISGVDPYRLEPDPQPDPQTVKKFEDFDRQVSDSFGDMLKD